MTTPIDVVELLGIGLFIGQFRSGNRALEHLIVPRSMIKHSSSVVRGWGRRVEGVRRRGGGILEVMGRDFRLISGGHDPMTALAFKLAI